MAGRPSKRSIDKAGTLLRDWWRDETAPETPELQAALDLVSQYRASFQTPLVKVNNGLRNFVNREGAQVVVSQRLKRIPTIIDKLDRLQNMKLTQHAGHRRVPGDPRRRLAGGWGTSPGAEALDRA